MTDADRITQEVRALERLDLEGLRAAWRARYGEAPKLRSKALLAQLLAWRIQTEAFGDGGEALKRLLAASPKAETALGPAMAPGSRLRREWRGVVHELVVVEAGFELRGQVYPSLSKAAFAITGVKWNGPRFFGLRATS